MPGRHGAGNRPCVGGSEMDTALQAWHGMEIPNREDRPIPPSQKLPFKGERILSCKLYASFSFLCAGVRQEKMLPLLRGKINPPKVKASVQCAVLCERLGMQVCVSQETEKGILELLLQVF